MTMLNKNIVYRCVFGQAVWTMIPRIIGVEIDLQRERERGRPFQSLAKNGTREFEAVIERKRASPETQAESTP